MADTMDLKGAAEYLHLALAPTKRLIDTGEIPAVRVTQKHTVVLRSSLEAYVKAEGERQAKERRSAAIARTVTANRGKRRAPADLSKYEAGITTSARRG